MTNRLNQEAVMIVPLKTLAVKQVPFDIINSKVISVFRLFIWQQVEIQRTEYNVLATNIAILYQVTKVVLSGIQFFVCS